MLDVAISGKKGGFDDLSEKMACAFIAVVMKYEFNFSKLVFSKFCGNFAGSPFLKYPRFLQMIINKNYPELEPTAKNLQTKVIGKDIFAYMSMNQGNYYQNLRTWEDFFVLNEGRSGVRVDTALVADEHLSQVELIESEDDLIISDSEGTHEEVPINKHHAEQIRKRKRKLAQQSKDTSSSKQVTDKDDEYVPSEPSAPPKSRRKMMSRRKVIKNTVPKPKTKPVKAARIPVPPPPLQSQPQNISPPQSYSPTHFQTHSPVSTPPASPLTQVDSPPSNPDTSEWSAREIHSPPMQRRAGKEPKGESPDDMFAEPVPGYVPESVDYCSLQQRVFTLEQNSAALELKSATLQMNNEILHKIVETQQFELSELRSQLPQALQAIARLESLHQGNQQR